MKILQIIHCFPPESMTGSEIYAYRLSRCLAKSHSVSVFYRTNKPDEEEYKVVKDKYEGLGVYKINNTLRYTVSLEGIYKNEKIEEAFLRILDDVHPDIAHIHHLLFLSTGIIDVLRKRKIPIVFTIHDYWLVCPRGQLLKNNLEICTEPLRVNCMRCLGGGISLKNLLKKSLTFLLNGNFAKGRRFDLKDIYRDADLFIAPSRFLRNKFIGFGIPPEKIIYSDNGMDFGLFKDAEKIKSDKIRFGFIGTLIPSKGAHVLIKAFNKIKKSWAVLKIYGKSPVNNGIFDYYHRIRKMADSNKNIRFMGTFDNRDAAEIFKEIDVLIFPSIWQENSPLILHEAILSNTFVIASDIGGIGEFLEPGKNSFLFKAGDSEGLYIYIKKILEHPEIIKNMKSENRIIKDIRDNCKELEDIYNRLLQFNER